MDNQTLNAIRRISKRIEGAGKTIISGDGVYAAIILDVDGYVSYRCPICNMGNIGTVSEYCRQEILRGTGNFSFFCFVCYTSIHIGFQDFKMTGILIERHRG